MSDVSRGILFMAEDLKIFLYENLQIWEGTFIHTIINIFIQITNLDLFKMIKIFYVVRESVKMGVFSTLAAAFIILSLCQMVRI